MYKTILMFLFVTFSIFAQPVVKGLKTYSTHGNYSLPVVERTYDDKSISSLIIDFDIEAELTPNLEIRFLFCDKNWQPYQRYELENNMYNRDLEIDLKVLHVNFSTTDYHFTGKYPSEDVTFPYAGKWIFEITDKYNRDIVYEYGKFYVVRHLVPMDVEIYDIRMEGNPSSPAILDNAHEVITSFVLPASLVASRVQGIELIKNKLIEFPYTVSTENNTDTRSFTWNGSDDFSFFVSDVHPGNEYRHVDIRDPAKYNESGAKVPFGGADRPRLYRNRVGNKDFNGSFSYSSIYYIPVTFEFIPDNIIKRDIFVTGPFTFWELWPSYKMEKVDGIYTLETELKRGIYDYEYVLGDLDENGNIINPDRYTLEGNFWETDNEYSVFLYYSTPELGGYDEIIGFVKIYSGVK